MVRISYYEARRHLFRLIRPTCPRGCPPPVWTNADPQSECLFLTQYLRNVLIGMYKYLSSAKSTRL